MSNDIPHENNYELVYSAWRQQQRLTDHEVAQRLNALRPSLQQLRRSYRNPSVRVEYGGAIAEAYLLAYVPPYIHQAQAVLRHALADMDFSTKDELRIGLLCPGPGPELIALVRELMALGASPKLHVSYLDIANRGWTSARQGLLQCASLIYSSDTNTRTVDIDLCSHLSADEIRQFSAFDLVIAQNMANEVADSAQALRNLASALTSLKAGAFLVISDQREYQATARLEEGLTRRLQSEFEVKHDAMPSSPTQQHCKRFSAPNFSPLDDNFFASSDGLIARKKMEIAEWIGVKRPAGRT